MLGVDLGSGGLRIAALSAAQQPASTLLERQAPYPGAFEDPQAWRRGLIALMRDLPPSCRGRIAAVAVDGTSGTLLLCRPDGSQLSGDLARALPYHLACPEQAGSAATIAGAGGPAASASGSLARALNLLQRAEAAGLEPPWLLRHQADWLMGWLLGDWRWGEDGNNLRLGWDLQRAAWSGALERQPWAAALPHIRASGESVGTIGGAAAAALGLPADCLVVAGSTDANAGVLAAAPEPGDGVTVLGTTLVLKQFVPEPIAGPGVSCHRVAGRWLAGGAANAGAGILLRFWGVEQLGELSRQIDPDRPTGLQLRPLPARGERFPWDDPALEPQLEPRPVSDALYLQALLEGLTAHEKAGWQRLRELGAPPVQRVISLGGGARNPQWRLLRQHALGLPVLNRPALSAARGMALLARQALLARRAPASSRPVRGRMEANAAPEP
ncbi:MAG: FGGY-family carbohydrate kinase [Cyanobium sp.]